MKRNLIKLLQENLTERKVLIKLLQEVKDPEESKIKTWDEDKDPSFTKEIGSKDIDPGFERKTPEKKPDLLPSKNIKDTVKDKIGVLTSKWKNLSPEQKQKIKYGGAAVGGLAGAAALYSLYKKSKHSKDENEE